MPAVESQALEAPQLGALTRSAREKEKFFLLIEVTLCKDLKSQRAYTEFPHTETHWDPGNNTVWISLSAAKEDLTFEVFHGSSVCTLNLRRAEHSDCARCIPTAPQLYL